MISPTTPSLPEKELESQSPCLDTHRRRDTAPWRTTIACIVFALAVTTSFYYSMGCLRLLCQDQLDISQRTARARKLIPIVTYGTPAIFLLGNSSNGIRASSIMRVSALDSPMVLHGPMSMILSDSERLVLKFTPPPEWSQRGCVVGVLVASPESTGDASSLSKKSVLYRYLGAEASRDLSKPFPCGLDENVMIEFSCRGRMCIAEDNERTGIRLFSQAADDGSM